MNNSHDDFTAACPSRRAIEIVSNKWALLIIPELRHGPVRNNELLRRIAGISQKMLTQTLRELEGNGLIERTAYASKSPHVEYALTALGASLSAALEPLDAWAKTNHAQLRRADAASSD